MTNVSATVDSASTSSNDMIAPPSREDEGRLPTHPQVERTALRRTDDFSLRTVAALFVLLLAVTSIPVVLHPWPPMSDYINHLARMQVIATVNSDPDLARFYEIDWQLLPNLMMDLLVPSLARMMNIYLAGQIYTISSFVLILSGTVALHRQLFGRWS